MDNVKYLEKLIGDTELAKEFIWFIAKNNFSLVGHFFRDKKLTEGNQTEARNDQLNDVDVSKFSKLGLTDLDLEIVHKFLDCNDPDQDGAECYHNTATGLSWAESVIHVEYLLRLIKYADKG